MAKRFNKLRLKAADIKGKGIVYIGHLPRGFEESELRKYFAQFGEVSKLRVSRSKKTGRSKGYAFLEFNDRTVAQTASGIMNGYLMFGKKVECHMVENAHKDTFKHGNRDWNFVPNQLIFRNKKNIEAKLRTPEQQSERVKGLL
jgi:nucleolar protein 15